MILTKKSPFYRNKPKTRVINYIAWVFILSFLPGQIYNLTVLGIKIGEINLEKNNRESIQISTKSTGPINYLWPFDNLYKTTFDTVTYGIRLYEKKIHQGEFKQKLGGVWIPGQRGVLYGTTLVGRPNDCQTIFTLLAQVSRQKAKDIDTKWYSMEHEGELFRARLLWADSINVWTGNDSILCDHYRLDIDSTENKIKILDQTDYFSENITRSDLIKQLWIKKSGEKKIIQASAQISGLAIKAIINLE
ncbi:MAG TPA: hypothetical protein QF355_08320 [Candidatus Marinimicrobia bacterium]|jgi:hypothetical protein|nr:hypothetical protein [Candidatus Neomarinimicrobiota bacterium]MEE1506248.1 hypothetical protein [Candidatus Neomarinimicrobiota bacterium]MEE1572902.1 hypothetical protein [Candidatus Neomarinimicrobiota bacterium]HJL79289.1 hypothetical protein [Candidatus Neomarinimicrobiota bacterium]HJN68421.1 hypothetical protein [Candidatus Neomarinimicrobiota bacterium]|tara:strand:- start:7755 stop:8498 length:744 start_codon:yes stop_codon:yes gene_type:complete